MQLQLPGIPAITYNEKSTGSPVYSFMNGQSHVERTFICDWKDRVTLVQGLLGYPLIVNGLKGSWIQRQLPDALPDFTVPNIAVGAPGDTWLYAASVIRGIGIGETGTYDANGIAQYQKFEVTIAYEPRTFKLLPDEELPVNPNTGVRDEGSLARYVTRTIKPSAEFIQIPKGHMFWNDGVRVDSKGKPTADLSGKPAPVEYGVARLLPSVELAYTWHEVPFIPDAITMAAPTDNASGLSFIGCLNHYSWTDGPADNPASNTYNPGTLLLLSAEVKPYRSAAGVFVNDIVYRMKYFEPVVNRGHNFFLRWYPTPNALYYTKMTSSGFNDVLGIPEDNFDGSPYNSATKPHGDMVPGGDNSKSLYGYAGFGSLFTSDVLDKDLPVGR